jgi:UDPglucose 6-dehydrogenase/GDP-mannose 6-dehydrogenase
MNPEFLREGVAISDFMEPDRIVLGGIDERTLAVLDRVYAPFAGVDILRTNPRTAETIKYAANALLATMISFSNEIGNLCARLDGVDVVEVMRGVHLDRRISPLLEDGRRIKPAFTTYLEAGCGFGGSCFPKDVKALIAYGSQAGSPMRVLDSVIEVNARQPAKVLDLLLAHFPELAGVRVTVLGLAFKPGTDDMRESPAIPIVRELVGRGARVRAFDPVAQHEARKLFGVAAVEFAETLGSALKDADAVLLLTRWPEFARLPELFAGMEREPLLVDGRRMLDKAGFRRYEGIGLKSS